MSFWTSTLMVLVKVVIFVWDLLTRPIYFTIYKPWKRRAAFKQPRSRRIAKSEGEMTFRGISRLHSISEEIQQNNINTLDRAFEFAFDRYQNRNCLGSRKIIKEEIEFTSDGKTIVKLIQGDYSWYTYNQLEERSTAFGKGLHSIGLQQRSKIVIYAETRPDWLVAAIGCFKYNFTLVTIYTNLGESGVLYGIGQTQAEFVLVSQELLPKFLGLLKELPQIKTIIVFEESHKGPISSYLDANVSCRILTFDEVIEYGYLSETISPRRIQGTRMKSLIREIDVGRIFELTHVYEQSFFYEK